MNVQHLQESDTSSYSLWRSSGVASAKQTGRFNVSKRQHELIVTFK